MKFIISFSFIICGLSLITAPSRGEIFQDSPTPGLTTSGLQHTLASQLFAGKEGKRFPVIFGTQNYELRFKKQKSSLWRKLKRTQKK